MSNEGRLCTPDMSPFERFQKDDEVAHVMNGRGRVLWNMGGKICVLFAKGKGFTATYDADWFKSNPRYLYHRDVCLLNEGHAGECHNGFAEGQPATTAEISEKVREQLVNNPDCY